MLAVLLAVCCPTLQTSPDASAPPPLRVEGVVLGFDREPVHNCEVWTGDDGPPRVPARTDASGMFALVAEPAVVLAINARLPGVGLGRTTTQGFGAVPCRVRIELSPSRVIRGTVATIDGQPLAGAWVTGSADDQDVAGTATRSDDQGRWQLDAVLSGTTTIRATKASLGSAMAVDDGAGDGLALEIDPDEARTLTISAPGVPVHHQLRLHAETVRGAAVPLPPELARPNLGADGRVAIRGLPLRARVRVLVESEGGLMRCDFMPTDVRDWSMEVRCDDAPAIAGTVRDAEGRPIADLLLASWSPESLWQRPTYCRSVRDGTWRMPAPVCAGAKIRLAVADPRWRVPSDEAVVFDPARQYDLRPRRAATLRGRVLDAKGAPVMGAIVWFYASTVSQALTVSDGSFAIPCTPGVQENVRVLVSEPQGCSSLDLRLGGEPEQDVGSLQLERGATIRGVARGADGSPLPNQRVQLHDRQRGGVRRVFTDAAGRWAFTGLLPGQFTVGNVNLRGAQMVALQQDADQTLVLTLR